MVTQSFRNKKVLITEEMISFCAEPNDLRTALRKWWINSTKHGGLRLTSTGYKILHDMQYEPYHFNADNISKSRTLLLLDNKISCPYYISDMNKQTQQIDLFGSKEATIIKLYGDFNSYLKSLLTD